MTDMESFLLGILIGFVLVGGGLVVMEVLRR